MPRDAFEIKFLSHVKTVRLVEKGESVMIACSGGADSTCLLHLMAKFRTSLGIKLAALYINHGIRGRGEIYREKKLLKQHCDRLGVPLVVKKIDAKGIAKKEKRSLEEAAREGRYSAIFAAMEEGGFDRCATAHHLDDSAESFLMKIFKGGSPSALAGIRQVLSGKIVRPLLFASKAEVEAYLSRNGIGFSLDSTNSDERFERNFIRKKVVPVVKEKFPGLLSKISTFQNIQRIENDFIDSSAMDFASRCFVFAEKSVSFDAGAFAAPHLAVKRRAFLLAVRRLGLDPSAVGFGLLSESLDFISRGPGEGRFEVLKGSLYLVKKTVYSARDYRPEKTTVFLTREKPSMAAGALPESGLAIDCGERLSFRTAHFEYDVALAKNDAGSIKAVSVNRNSVLVAIPHGVEPPLLISQALKGDRIAIAGGGSQKISDLFVNAKVPREIRREIPVFRDLSGEIVCVSNIKFSEYSAAAARAGLSKAGYFLSVGVKSIL